MTQLLNQEAQFKLYVSYNQIAVFKRGIENPFNDWSSKHINQGFSWRPGSVSFRTIEEEGDISIYVFITEKFNNRSESKRTIRVPFSIAENGNIEIASITDEQPLKLPPNNFSLFFETGLHADGEMWGAFTFCKEYKLEPEIIKADEKIIIPDEYLMTATSA